MQRRDFFGGVREHYDVEVIKAHMDMGSFEGRVPIVVPIYNVECVLHVVIDGDDAFLPAKITVEGFPNELRHVWKEGYLCMWKPGDPPDARWRPQDGLLKLLDTAVTHLFKERHFALHPDEGWIGEEVRHGSQEPKEAEPAGESPAVQHPPVSPPRPPTRLDRAA